MDNEQHAKYWNCQTKNLSEQMDRQIYAEAEVFTENFNVLNLLYKIFHLCWLPLVFPYIAPRFLHFSLFALFFHSLFISCYLVVCLFMRLPLYFSSLCKRITWHMAFISFSAIALASLGMWMENVYANGKKSSEPIMGTATTTTEATRQWQQQWRQRRQQQ